MKIHLKRTDKAFQMEAVAENGSKVVFDAGPKIGGGGNGVSPMQSLVMALGGCSAIDIILILQKQKQEIEDLQISIDGDREEGKEPSLWKNVHAKFIFKGKIDAEKAKRAVDLSMQKYCSVSATLVKAGAAITYEVWLNDQKVN